MTSFSGNVSSSKSLTMNNWRVSMRDLTTVPSTTVGTMGCMVCICCTGCIVGCMAEIVVA